MTVHPVSGGLPAEDLAAAVDRALDRVLGVAPRDWVEERPPLEVPDDGDTEAAQRLRMLHFAGP